MVVAEALASASVPVVVGEAVVVAEEEAAPASVLVVAAVHPASVNTLVRRKAKRLQKHQRESLDPH